MQKILISLGTFLILSGCASTDPFSTRFDGTWYFTEPTQVPMGETVEELQCVPNRQINSHHPKVCLDKHDIKELRETLIRCRNR